MNKFKKGTKLLAVINQKTKSFFKRKMVFVWTALFILSISSLFVLYQLSQAVDHERDAFNTEILVSSLGYQLKAGSDYLTAEARSFAVTEKPSYLINYWDEVYVLQNRDKVIKKLKTYHVSKDIAHLLVKSKRNSDALINTEIRSMYLVLSAYGVPKYLFPPDVRSYRPAPSDISLAPNEKILLAQKIMFDNNYVTNKALIMNPINEFERKILEKAKINSLKAQTKKDDLVTSLSILLILLALVINSIAWYRLIE